MVDSTVISYFSLAISSVAIYFTFKKDAHRIRFRHQTFSGKYLDYLWINNDSSFQISISAIGHVDLNGDIRWLEKIGEVRNNEAAPYPIIINGRSSFNGFVTHNIHHFPSGSTYGFCVQLDCGRTFVSAGNLPLIIAAKLEIMSAISWLTSGCFGFEKRSMFED